jgi:hypothetical protein
MKVNVSGYSGRDGARGEYGISLYVTVPNSMGPEEVRGMTAAAPDLLKGCAMALEMLRDPESDYLDAAKLETLLEQAIIKARGGGMKVNPGFTITTSPEPRGA